MIEIVAAVANGGVIGNKGELPWQGQLPADTKHFRELTMGHTVVMGRKTWDSLPKRYRPLPGRFNLVISHQPVVGAPQTVALDWLAQQPRAARLFVIGGSQIYRQVWDLAEILHVTHIDADFAGDCVFPEILGSQWQVVESGQYHEPVAPNMTPYWFATYRRRR